MKSDRYQIPHHRTNTATYHWPLPSLAPVWSLGSPANSKRMARSLARRWATLPFSALAPRLEATSSMASSESSKMNLDYFFDITTAYSLLEKRVPVLRWDQREKALPNGRWASRPACIKWRSFFRRISFVLL